MRLIHSVPVLALALCVTFSSAATAQEEAAGADPAEATNPSADSAATIADPDPTDPASGENSGVPPANDPASEASGTTGTGGTAGTTGTAGAGRSVATGSGGAGGTATGFSCRASAARLTLAGQSAVEPAVANDDGGSCVADLPELVENLSLGELGSVSLLAASTGSGGDSQAKATARVASVVLTPAVGTVIQLDLLTSSTTGRCSGGEAVLDGEARVLSMQTNGEAPVAVPDQDDLVVFEEGGVTLTLNRTTSDGSSQTEQAAVLETTLGEVVIGETVVEAGADACAGVPDDGNACSVPGAGDSGSDAENPGSVNDSSTSATPGFGVNLDLGGSSGHNRLLPGLDAGNPLGGGSNLLGGGTGNLPLGSAGLPLGNPGLPLGGSGSSLGGALPSLGGDLPLGETLGGDGEDEEDSGPLGALLDLLSLAD